MPTQNSVMGEMVGMVRFTQFIWRGHYHDGFLFTLPPSLSLCRSVVSTSVCIYYQSCMYYSYAAYNTPLLVVSYEIEKWRQPPSNHWRYYASGYKYFGFAGVVECVSSRTFLFVHTYKVHIIEKGNASASTQLSARIEAFRTEMQCKNPACIE